MNVNTAIILSRLTAQQRAMDVVAGNIANASTPGYRAERVVFADWLATQTNTSIAKGDSPLAFTQDRATYRDRAEGTLQQTGNPLDLALSGDGYFTVSTPAGPRLTRAGRFTLQADGSITDPNGNALLDSNTTPMRLQPTDTRLTVTGDGTLSSQNGPIGRIAVVAPNDPNKLTAEGNRLFRADAPTTPVAKPKIIQGVVEDSNVQPIAELAQMMTVQRDFQFATQFLQAEGQREQDAIDKIATPLN
jgi:flagellar basal-body rod protein FlgF